MNELLERIKYNNGKFPEKELKEIIEHKEEFIPELLQVLKDSKENYKEIEEDHDYYLHIYACFLLAQFREKIAFPLIIDLFSLPDGIPYNMFGEVITEELDKILASVYDGNIDPIKELIENKSIDEYVRIAGISTFLVLFREGLISREEIVEYYKSLFNDKLEKEYSQVWGGLVSACCDIYPEEFYEDIKKLYEEELVEDLYISLEEVDDTMKCDKDAVLLELKKSKYKIFISDTIKEIRSWASFDKESRDDRTFPYIQRHIKDNNKLNKEKSKKKNERKQAKATKKKQRKK